MKKGILKAGLNAQAFPSIIYSIDINPNKDKEMIKPIPMSLFVIAFDFISLTVLKIATIAIISIPIKNGIIIIPMNVSVWLWFTITQKEI